MQTWTQADSDRMTIAGLEGVVETLRETVADQQKTIDELCQTVRGEERGRERELKRQMAAKIVVDGHEMSVYEARGYLLRIAENGRASIVTTTV